MKMVIFFLFLLSLMPIDWCQSEETVLQIWEKEGLFDPLVLSKEQAITSLKGAPLGTFILAPTESKSQKIVVLYKKTKNGEVVSEKISISEFEQNGDEDKRLTGLSLSLKKQNDLLRNYFYHSSCSGKALFEKIISDSYDILFPEYFICPNQKNGQEALNELAITYYHKNGSGGGKLETHLVKIKKGKFEFEGKTFGDLNEITMSLGLRQSKLEGPFYQLDQFNESLSMEAPQGCFESVESRCSTFEFESVAKNIEDFYKRLPEDYREKITLNLFTHLMRRVMVDGPLRRLPIFHAPHLDLETKKIDGFYSVKRSEIVRDGKKNEIYRLGVPSESGKKMVIEINYDKLCRAIPYDATIIDQNWMEIALKSDSVAENCESLKNVFELACKNGNQELKNMTNKNYFFPPQIESQREVLNEKDNAYALGIFLLKNFHKEIFNRFQKKIESAGGDQRKLLEAQINFQNLLKEKKSIQEIENRPLGKIILGLLKLKPSLRPDICNLWSEIKECEKS